MNDTTTIRTTLEYSVMPIQRYEFVCQGCFMVKTINDATRVGARGDRIGGWCGDCA